MAEVSLMTREDVQAKGRRYMGACRTVGQRILTLLDSAGGRVLGSDYEASEAVVAGTLGLEASEVVEAIVSLRDRGEVDWTRDELRRRGVASLHRQTTQTRIVTWLQDQDGCVVDADGQIMRTLCEELELTYPAAIKAVAKLEQLGIVQRTAATRHGTTLLALADGVMFDADEAGIEARLEEVLEEVEADTRRRVLARVTASRTT